MDEKYWDNVASDYDGQIFSVLANDRRRAIVSGISRFADPDAVACDFGCGVGKFLPGLAENFQHVHAVDISPRLLTQARRKCRPFDNISYYKKDLSRPGIKLPKVDFALCVNVAIMPSLGKCRTIFRNIARHLRAGGHCLLVVPSLESALYADFRLVQWNEKVGSSRRQIRDELQPRDSDLPIRQGIVEIDNVGTKHYLKEELLVLFAQLGLEVVSTDKVEYCWETEFEKPPKWMGRPYPWDWLVTLRKAKS